MNATTANFTARPPQPWYEPGIRQRFVGTWRLRALALGAVLLLWAPVQAAPPTVASAARASLLASEAASNEVRDAARDEFLRMHRWNDRRNNWQPLRVAPRNMTAMSVTQLRTENSLLRQTHQWDASTAQWLPRGQRSALR
ncbi:MAG: hypothetical protein Q8R98_06080 [Rubrivivax sp.]|nr:hypothetical protein [Rubrivivax sp.]MDP3611400.1 hypothetical protein [Rubrivivax sp.]